MLPSVGRQRLPRRHYRSALRVLERSTTPPTIAVYSWRCGSFCRLARAFLTLRSGLPARKHKYKAVSVRHTLVHAGIYGTYRTTITGTGLCETQYRETEPMPGAPSALPQVCSLERVPLVPTIRAEEKVRMSQSHTRVRGWTARPTHSPVGTAISNA